MSSKMTIHGWNMRDNGLPVDGAIAGCVAQIASHDGHHAQTIERFLRTGEVPSEAIKCFGGGLAGLRELKRQSDMCEAALRLLFNRLEALLPREAIAAATMIRKRVHPMVCGLLPPPWREVALRELGDRVFVLNLVGARRAFEAEISTGWLHSAWQTLWIYFADYGLVPQENMKVNGMASGTFAHVSLSAFTIEDPYADVIVHEAAHLLHYLKPGHFGLSVLRGGERFFDVAYGHRELFAYVCEVYSQVIKKDRKHRAVFVDAMDKNAPSFPAECLPEVKNLVLSAVLSGNGWDIIRKALAERRGQKSKREVLRRH